MYDPMRFVPTKGFLTRGVGRHKHKLTSFEMALRDAGIEKYNLVRVSSIFPPHCKLVSRQEGMQLLRPGQVVFAVLAESATNEPSRMVAASIGLAIPSDPNHYGYISEHHAYGMKEQVAGDYAEDLAASMLATTLGVPFDPNQAWDERREAYLMSGDIVKTREVTQTAECGPDGLWTTVVAACVYVEYHEGGTSAQRDGAAGAHKEATPVVRENASVHREPGAPAHREAPPAVQRDGGTAT